MARVRIGSYRHTGIEVRELEPQDSLLLPNDHAPILWVPASQWVCRLCHPRDDQGSATSVSWVGSFGRCSLCGQKYETADARDKHVPSIEEQLGWR